MLSRLLREDLARAWGLLGEQYSAVARVEADCYLVTGSGDNYALALAAPGLAPGRLVVPVDPLQLSEPIAAAYTSRGCVLVALSLGGRTRSVVAAERAYREAGGRVVAVTADPESPVAREAGEVAVVLHGGTAGGVGAGRHLLAATALAAVLGAPPPDGVEQPRTCPEGFTVRSIHTGYLESLGSAVYAALKAYEVYGVEGRAAWWSLEQLVHAPIYSVPPDRSVVVYHASQKHGYIGEAVDTLREAGYRVVEVEARGNPTATLVWQAATIIECLARDPHLPPEPAYRQHSSLDRLTRLIYG